MGRPRKHATPAERQAAYRLRQAQAGAGARTELEARAERLRAAMVEAAAAGVALARYLHGGSAEANIGNLALWFERQAVECREAAARETTACGSADPRQPAREQRRTRGRKEVQGN